MHPVPQQRIAVVNVSRVAQVMRKACARDRTRGRGGAWFACGAAAPQARVGPTSLCVNYSNGSYGCRISRSRLHLPITRSKVSLLLGMMGEAELLPERIKWYRIRYVDDV